MLAETLCVQFFLSLAGIEDKVIDILPWFIKKSVPLIEEVLIDLPLHKIEETKPVIDYWIRDQKEYHKNALSRAEIKKERKNMFQK